MFLLPIKRVTSETPSSFQLGGQLPKCQPQRIHPSINTSTYPNQLQNNMVQILQITLREAEFKIKTGAGAKTAVKVFFAESEKSFPSPKMIKNDVCNFYGERMSLSTNQDELVDKAYVNVTVLDAKGKGTDYGDVEIDLEQVRAQKDGTRVKLDLANDSYFLSLEVLLSSYGGTSEIDNKSERSETLSPLRPKSTVPIVTKAKQTAQEVSPYATNERVSGNPSQRQRRAQIKRDADKPASKTFELGKKSSMSNLQERPVDDDRKSDISQRPVRKNAPGTKDSKDSTYSREISISQTARPATPPPSVRKIKRPIEIKTEQPQEESAVKALLKRFESKDFIQFAAVSVVSFVVGMIFKKL